MAYETPERLKKQLDFILQADAEKEIERRTLISSGKRFENDSEHAWHMALMAILLSEYANEEIDVLKTVTMILIHDIVEIDAGDTYCYDYELGKSQREREVKAANRIYALLPDDQGKNCARCGMSLRQTKRLRRILPTRWTACSPRCSTTPQTVRCGKRTA